jgi:hypothetical protein
MKDLDSLLDGFLKKLDAVCQQIFRSLWAVLQIGVLCPIKELLRYGLKVNTIKLDEVLDKESLKFLIGMAKLELEVEPSIPEIPPEISVRTDMNTVLNTKAKTSPTKRAHFIIGNGQSVSKKNSPFFASEIIAKSPDVFRGKERSFNYSDINQTQSYQGLRSGNKPIMSNSDVINLNPRERCQQVSFSPMRKKNRLCLTCLPTRHQPKARIFRLWMGIKEYPVNYWPIGLVHCTDRLL